MKKAGLILLTFVLCASTVFSFAYNAVPKEKIESDMIAKAASLEDIKDALRKTGMFDNNNSLHRKYGMFTYGGASGTVFETADLAVNYAPIAGSVMNKGDADIDMPSEAFDEAGGAEGSSDYSRTNTQIDGIDEADIVKTDGRYIYIAANRHIYIVSADKEKMKVISKLNEDGYIRNIFIDDNRLIVFGGNTVTDEPPALYEENGDDESKSKIRELPMPISSPMASADYDIDTGYNFCDYKTFTYVNIYDTENKEKPELIQEFSVEGDFVTARKSGNLIYLVASKYIYGIADLEKAGSGDIMPLYKDTEAKLKNKETYDFGGEKMIVTNPSQVYLCPIKESAAFTTLAVLDTAGDEEADIKSYMGSVREFYMNKESAFLTFDNYEYNEKTHTSREYTDIIALDIDGRNVTYRADGTVNGHLLNQFSMDEYGGYFRIATTEWDSGNGQQSSNLFVLDENLDTVGSIRNIAEGEQIYSVRFMGDKGYIVTFETVDPFFTVDLSDPSDPKIAGELKLPGYSNYLHQIDENTVLGVGRQTKELITRDEFGNEEAVGFRQGGIKLSLFDISNFAEPKELDSYVLGDDSIWSDALYDHKAIMINKTENLVGICASSYSGDSHKNGAYLFNVGNGSITLKGSAEITAENNYMNSEYEESAFYYSRLCYAGDTYYYLNEGTIYAMQIDDNSFGTIAQLQL